MGSSASGRTGAAVLWVLAAKQAERGLGIVSIFILARLLAPADFGIFVLAGSVVALVDVFSRFGFDWGVVRLPDPQREHYDTAWTLRVIVGGIVFVCVLALAYPAAALLKNPAVAMLIAALGLNVFLGSLENIWMAEYRRKTEFGPEFKMRVGAKLAGFVLSILFAIATRSYWALIAGVVASTAATVVLSYVLHASRPRWCLSKRSELLGFSIWLLGTNVIETLRVKFADFWIGRYFGASAVGHYGMAQELAALAGEEIAAPINRVVYANYAQAGDNLGRLREMYLQVSGVIWLVAVPASVGVWLCGKQIIAVLLGAQWGESVALLEILAIVGLLTVMEANTRTVYFGLGRAAFVSVLSGLGLFVFIASAIHFGAEGGVVGVAWAQVVASAFVLVVNMTALFKMLQINVLAFAARNYRAVLASAAMAWVVMWTERDVLSKGDFVPLVELLAMAATGVVVYALTLAALCWATRARGGPEELLLSVVRQRLRRN